MMRKIGKIKRAIDTAAISDAIKVEASKRAEHSARRGNQNKRNIYVCEACKEHIVTVDIDDGVTPFMIGCQCTDGCKGMMVSSMYRVWDQSMKASHEWRRPPASVWGELSPGALAHVQKGGLILVRAS